MKKPVHDIGIIILVLLLFLILVIAMNKHQTKVFKKRFIHADTTEWKGIINEVFVGSKGYYMKIKNNTTFSLPETNSIKEGRKLIDLEDIASAGDSIYKPKYGDTIYLYKKDQTYKFPLKEIEFLKDIEK